MLKNIFFFVSILMAIVAVAADKVACYQCVKVPARTLIRDTMHREVTTCDQERAFQLAHSQGYQCQKVSDETQGK